MRNSVGSARSARAGRDLSGIGGCRPAARRGSAPPRGEGSCCGEVMSGPPWGEDRKRLAATGPLARTSCPARGGLGGGLGRSVGLLLAEHHAQHVLEGDRKSTRLNSSH